MCRFCRLSASVNMIYVVLDVKAVTSARTDQREALTQNDETLSKVASLSQPCLNLSDFS